MTPFYRKLAITTYFVVAVLSVLVFFALLGLQTYVRWAVNLEFSFLPGFGFESLALLVLGELLGLAYLLRAEK